MRITTGVQSLKEKFNISVNTLPRVLAKKKMRRLISRYNEAKFSSWLLSLA